MQDLSRIRHWLEAGKQIGLSFRFEKEGEWYWSSVGVEQVSGGFLLYIDHIQDQHLACPEDYLVAETLLVDQFDGLAPLLAAKTTVTLERLTPCKGQKIFNPLFY